MAYSHSIKLVVGDTLPELFITLRDSNSPALGKVLDPNNPATWAPINVTGATVKLKVREFGSSTLHATLTCYVNNGPAGIVYTDFPEGTWNKAGKFEGEVEITFSTGGVQTVQDLLEFKVRGEF